MYSLRRTLAVRLCLTLLVALTLIGAWAFLSVHRTLRFQLDQSLAAALALELDAIGDGARLDLHNGPADTAAFVRDINRLVVLRDAEGNVVAANSPLATGLARDSAAFAGALAGERRWVTQPWGSGWVRALYAPVPPGVDPRGVVMEVAASTAPLSRANRDTLFVMIGTVVLSLVATAFGATWLAGSAVAPVEEIARQAEGIGRGRLGQRITVHADIEELQTLNTVLNRMLERLDHAFDAQRRIIADVGHDLRTPLTAMRGQIEVALRGERAPAEYRRTLASVLEDLDHLGSISESLILLARIEAGDLAPEPQRVGLADLARAAVRRAEPRAGGRRFSVVVPEGSDVTVSADPAMIGLVLDHLLDNTIRHTPPGTTVETSVSVNGDRATIAVRDNGPGISPAALPRLFERFYRGDDARTRMQGGGVAGLGLTIAAAIVDAHHGTITAENLATGGLEVRITLPR
ncbi:MAG TPA: ATP-binding protein [Gemmatimonadales bacterium]|nr:ATP-binding protein [Gemmatimonadales bacterium]